MWDLGDGGQLAVMRAPGACRPSRAEAVGRPDLEGGSRGKSALRAGQLHHSLERLLQLSAATLVLPGHDSDPIAFDGKLMATTVGTIRDTLALTQMVRDEFVEVVLARIPVSPPNHSRIVVLNERGEVPEDASELEAGANRCAIV